MKSTDLRLDLGIWNLAEMLAGQDVTVRVHLAAGIVAEGQIVSVTKGNAGAATVRMKSRPMPTGYGSTDRFAQSEIVLFEQRSIQMITLLGVAE